MNSIRPFGVDHFRAEFSSKRANTIWYRCRGLVRYLSVYQHIPYYRITALFIDLLGLTVNEGTIDKLLERIAQNAKPLYEDIRERIQQGQVVGSDETGSRFGGKKGWFHVWETIGLTFIVASLHKYTVLYRYEKLGPNKQDEPNYLLMSFPRSGEGYRIKELFSTFWELDDSEQALAFLTYRCDGVMETDIQLFKKFV